MRPIHRSYSVSTVGDQSVRQKGSVEQVNKDDGRRSKFVDLISRFNQGSARRSVSSDSRERYTAISTDCDTRSQIPLVKNLFSRRVSQEIDLVLKFEVSEKLPDVARDCFLQSTPLPDELDNLSGYNPTSDLVYPDYDSTSNLPDPNGYTKGEAIYDVPKPLRKIDDTNPVVWLTAEVETRVSADFVTFDPKGGTFGTRTVRAVVPEHQAEIVALRSSFQVLDGQSATDDLSQAAVESRSGHETFAKVCKDAEVQQDCDTVRQSLLECSRPTDGTDQIDYGLEALKNFSFKAEENKDQSRSENAHDLKHSDRKITSLANLQKSKSSNRLKSSAQRDVWDCFAIGEVSSYPNKTEQSINYQGSNDIWQEQPFRSPNRASPEMESFYERLPACRIEFSEFPRFPKLSKGMPITSSDLRSKPVRGYQVAHSAGKPLDTNVLPLAKVKSEVGFAESTGRARKSLEPSPDLSTCLSGNMLKTQQTKIPKWKNDSFMSPGLVKEGVTARYVPPVPKENTSASKCSPPKSSALTQGPTGELSSEDRKFETRNDLQKKLLEDFERLEVQFQTIGSASMPAISPQAESQIKLSPSGKIGSASYLGSLPVPPGLSLEKTPMLYNLLKDEQQKTATICPELEKALSKSKSVELSFSDPLVRLTSFSTQSKIMDAVQDDSHEVSHAMIAGGSSSDMLNTTLHKPEPTLLIADEKGQKPEVQGPSMVSLEDGNIQDSLSFDESDQSPPCFGNSPRSTADSKSFASSNGQNTGILTSYAECEFSYPTAAFCNENVIKIVTQPLSIRISSSGLESKLSPVEKENKVEPIYATIQKKIHGNQSKEKSPVIGTHEPRPLDSPQDESPEGLSFHQMRAFWDSRGSTSPVRTNDLLRRTQSFVATSKKNVILSDPDVVREFKDKVKRSSSLEGSRIAMIALDTPGISTFQDLKKDTEHLCDKIPQPGVANHSLKEVGYVEDAPKPSRSSDKKEPGKKRVVVRSDSYKIHELRRFWENAKKKNVSSEENNELNSLEADQTCTELFSTVNSKLMEATFSKTFSKSFPKKKTSVGSMTSGYSSSHDVSDIFNDSVDIESEFASLEDELDDLETNDLSIDFDDFEKQLKEMQATGPPLPPRKKANDEVPARPAKPPSSQFTLKSAQGHDFPMSFSPVLHSSSLHRASPPALQSLTKNPPTLPPLPSTSPPALALKNKADCRDLPTFSEVPLPTNAVVQDCEEISSNFDSMNADMNEFPLLDHLCLPKQGDVFYKSASKDEAGVFVSEVIALNNQSISRNVYKTQVEIFFRSGTLSKLETQRDDRITGNVIRLQACCRGYLARKRLERRKIEDTAVRCVQRNVRKLLGVREWPWWRLLMKLQPLMNVHRTEEELRSATDELIALRARVVALEKDKTDLKIVSDKLEIKVSELTADLAEEHSTAVLATDRLEAETSERLKLEKDVKELQSKLNSMTQDHDRLEFEVLCSRASHLGAESANSDDLDSHPDVSVYKQKLDRCTRDLEFMKEKLKSQHEDDLDQMVTVKKQLEKKLADAYEEVEEQRQVAAQWKRKAQRLGQEANDVKLLMDETTTRNAALEKKQRKFDSDMQILQDELRQERSLKERLHREREQLTLEKEHVEQELQSAHLDLEMRSERITALQREVEALSTDGKSDAESALLRRTKLELESKVKDQEEELDDLAGQVQLLESAKVRLELQLENLRKDYKRELTSKEEEVEEIRCSAQKKVKGMEAQLESEHDERTAVVREKHELERRLLEMTSLLSQSTNEEVVHKLKKDLKRSKALLKDAQLQLEQAKSDTPSKVLLRQLRNQLEDAEFARTAAIKGRQNAEQELGDLQIQYEELQKFRNDAEDKYLHVSRERGNLQAQLDDLEAEMSEVMRKYKSTVQQLSIDQLTIQDQVAQISSLEFEKQALKESLAEISCKLENMEGDAITTHAQKRLELKIRELESKAELEHTSRQRLETQILRLRETVEKSAIELENSKTKEQSALDSVKRLQRQIRDMREELTGVSQRDTEASQKVREFVQSIDLLEAENEALKRDLNIALRRIDDLQSAMQGDSESPDSDGHLSDSDSDDSISTVDTLMSSRRPLAASSQSSLPSTSRRKTRTPSPVDF